MLGKQNLISFVPFGTKIFGGVLSLPHLKMWAIIGIPCREFLHVKLW